MTDGAIYRAGWTLDDIDWARFDASKVDGDILNAVKAASLIEYNAADYVGYLKRVYHNAHAATLAAIEHWGTEEVQHGLALARWATLADPSFDLQTAFARFRELYRPTHFDQGVASIRGSKRGEMISRCVVESGTSSFYTAMRDASEEPVLKEVAGRIAADEFRHYLMFYDILQKECGPDISRWRKIWVAVGRLGEAGDDEIAGAYYCANVPASETAAKPYERKHYAYAYNAKIMVLYRRHHIDKMVKMVAKPAGVDPSGWLSRFAGATLWHILQRRAARAAIA